MVLGLPAELSNTWKVVDDVVNYVRSFTGLQDVVVEKPKEQPEETAEIPLAEYGAVVSEHEAVFTFPITPKERYEWYSGGLQYAWSVKVSNNGQDFDFGFYLITPMGATPPGEGNFQQLLNEGQFSIWDSSGRNISAVGTIDGVVSGDQKLLTIKLTGAKTIQLLFSSKPKYCIFESKLLDKTYSKKVLITYAETQELLGKLSVNGEDLSNNQERWVRFVAETVFPQLLGNRTNRLHLAARVSWWGLKEGTFSLPNPHKFSSCSGLDPESGGYKQNRPLAPTELCVPVSERKFAWQVGLAAVQATGDHSEQEVLDAVQALWPGRAIKDVLAEAAKIAELDPSTTAKIIASSGDLRKSWLLRHPVVGFTLEEPVVSRECVDRVKPLGWCSGATFAATPQDIQQSITDLIKIFNSLSKEISKSKIRDIDFQNFTCPVVSRCNDDVKGNRVAVRNGKYISSHDDTYGPIGFSVSEEVTYGDLTGDTDKEAVLTTSCGFIDSENLQQWPWQVIYVYTMESGQPKLLSTIEFIGYEEAYQKYYPDGTELFYLSLEGVQDGMLVIGSLAGKARCCPMYDVKINLRWDGQRFVLSGKPLRTPWQD